MERASIAIIPKGERNYPQINTKRKKLKTRRYVNNVYNDGSHSGVMHRLVSSGRLSYVCVRVSGCPDPSEWCEGAGVERRG